MVGCLIDCAPVGDGSRAPSRSRDLTGSAHRVGAGQQLAFAIAPSRCGFGENPNSGEPIEEQTSRLVATIDVALGSSGAVLALPTNP
jgi:hypothetical protein